MTLPLALFAIDVVAVFTMLLLGACVLLSQPRARNAWLLALICFDSACFVALARQDYAYWIPASLQVHYGQTLTVLLDVARNLTPGLFMLLCHALFQEGQRFPRLLVTAFVIQLLLEQPLQLIAPEWSAARPLVFETVPALLQLVFAGSALYWTVTGWRADLVEQRRHLRWLFLVIIGVYLFIAVLLLRLLLPVELILHYYVDEALTAALATLGTAALLAWSSPGNAAWLTPYTVAQPPPPPSPTSTDDADLARLRRAFDDAHVYREGGLSVGALAAQLKLPEYRVRRLIHERLGHRNFNALLHEYRIAEASRMLADADLKHLPILTIALTVGYRSINPFNRAFKELHGVTPSAFRASAAAGSESQNRTDS